MRTNPCEGWEPSQGSGSHLPGGSRKNLCRIVKIRVYSDPSPRTALIVALIWSMWVRVWSGRPMMVWPMR
jgi:hypothetical protein